jgi:N-glycosylase/DNA lyase
MPSPPLPHTTAWRAWPGIWTPNPAVLRETLDGGQAFRWREPTPGIWRGQWLDHQVELTRDAVGTLAWRPLHGPMAASEAALRHYLAEDQDWAALADALPWRSDAHLGRAMAAFPGLRLLRQPFGETLLAFLCSATKQIPQIKQMLAHLAARHGSAVAYFVQESDTPTNSHALPTWTQLATVPESALRECQLGFRARHIAAVARRLAAEPGWLDETAHAPYAEAKARLLTLPGVGEKVADCVLLFGGGHLEAFPVDTWILKAMQRHYGLAGWAPAQIAHFGRQHFGPAAGLAQQYLFAWERAHGRTTR